MKASHLSKHEVVRRLKISPSQLYRLLDPTNYRKSIDEMLRLLTVLGCRVGWSIVKQAAWSVGPRADARSPTRSLTAQARPNSDPTTPLLLTSI